MSKTIQELKGHMNNFLYLTDDRVTMKKEDVETISHYIRKLEYDLARSEKAHARAISEGLRILSQSPIVVHELDTYC